VTWLPARLKSADFRYGTAAHRRAINGNTQSAIKGGFFAVGRSEGVVPPHAHHAIQIVIAVEGAVGIRGRRGDWHMGSGVAVRPDVEHSYNANDAAGSFNPFAVAHGYLGRAALDAGP
jgi:hypothetical protein